MDQSSFKPLLLKIVTQPDSFNSEDVSQAIDHLAQPDAASPAQIGAFLTALTLSRRDKTPEILSATASAMMRHSVSVSIVEPSDFYVDIVGTGGDGHNTFNVSTSAAIVAAGAGARVIKHGNKASTSSSGSADILRALDCALPPPPANHTLPKIPFTFLLASNYHPAMAAIAPHRKSLPFRTLFNVIGPLINPARPRGMILGVADPDLGATFARALQQIGVERAMVVCGQEKLDEISIAGLTHVWSFQSGSGDIVNETIDPSMFGLSPHPLSEVGGASADDNALVLLKLLTPQSTNLPLPLNMTSSLDSIRDFILINAAALLVVAGVATSYADGVALARESISSGRALEALNLFRDTA